jgi:hypothetical protein
MRQLVRQAAVFFFNHRMVKSKWEDDMDDAKLIKELAAEVDRQAGMEVFNAQGEHGLLESVVSKRIQDEYGIDFEVGQPIGPVPPDTAAKAKERFSFLVAKVTQERQRRVDDLHTDKLDGLFGGEEPTS